MPTNRELLDYANRLDNEAHNQWVFFKIYYGLIRREHWKQSLADYLRSIVDQRLEAERFVIPTGAGGDVKS